MDKVKKNISSLEKSIMICLFSSILAWSPVLNPKKASKESETIQNKSISKTRKTKARKPLSSFLAERNKEDIIAREPKIIEAKEKGPKNVIKSPKLIDKI